MNIKTIRNSLIIVMFITLFLLFNSTSPIGSVFLAVSFVLYMATVLNVDSKIEDK